MRHLLAVFLLLLVALAACDEDEPTAPRLEPGPGAPWLRDPSAPESLIHNLQVIYDDKMHTAGERIAAYADLLGPDFVFFFQPADYEEAGRQSWGPGDEIKAHASIFEAQARGHIYSLELGIVHLPPRDLDPPDPERPGWKELFATNVHLRLLTTPQDGFEVSGAQAEFLFHPAQGRWFIAEWRDLPSPEAVEPVTWGRIKLSYR